MCSKNSVRDGHHICRRLVGCLLAAGSILAFECVGWNAGSVAYAVVPPSLVQRTQEASVEAILVALEAKAAAAGDGTWTLGSGPQDRPAVSYASGFAGGRWYLKRTDGQAEYVLFSDGSEFFELPDRVTYTLYTADKGERHDYGLGQYLLHVNLRPRQFLGVKELKNLGEVTVDGAALIHLQALIADGEAAKADPPAQVWNSQPQVQLIDYYYDAVRQSISAVTINLGDGSKVRSSVTGWDVFGTAAQWPRMIVGQSVPAADAQGLQRQPVVTTVQGFQSGDDPEVARLAEVVANVPFFAGVPQELRRPQVYAKALETDPQNLTTRVLLTQAYFRAEQPKQGLEQWEGLKQAITDPAQQEQLKSMMVEAAAGSLSIHALRNPEQAPACVQVIQRLHDQEMTREQWRFASSPLIRGWIEFRGTGQFTEQLEPLDQPLIDRVARGGSYGALNFMINFAWRNKAFAAKIDPALAAVAAEPLPASGYADTQQSLLISLVVRQSHWDRADAYVAALKWDPATPDSAKAAVNLLRTMLQQRADDPAKLPAATLVQQYAQTTDPALAADEPTRQALRMLAVRLGVLAVRGTGKAEEQLVPPAELVAASADQPNAAEFWDAVIEGLLVGRPPTDASRQLVIERTAQLGAACQQQFTLADYESRTWLRIGTAAGIYDPRVHSPLMRIEHLNKAFVTADSDAGRLAAMEAMVAVLSQAGQHDQAVQTVEGLKPSLASSESQAEADALIAQVQQDKKAYEAQAAARQKQVEIDRAKGRVAFLQERLSEAEKQNRPAGDVQALQQVLDQARQELEGLGGGAS